MFIPSAPNLLACQEQTRQPVVGCACRQAWHCCCVDGGKEKGMERKGKEEVNSTCEELDGCGSV